MNGKGPFDPRKEAPLLSAYVDGELETVDVDRIEAHLAENEQTRREVRELRRLKDITGVMRIKEPPPEEWEVFWKSVYNRAERSLGWILLCVGLVAIGAWGITEILSAMLETEALPLYVKGGIFVLAAGALVLMISAIRERVYKRKQTRYKDVIR
ncbi:MAG: zf-HC2 domain-containing protein [Candidatus Krumholzibacteria bacterium]|nr:zf-HC2 domain-containing protein [Candidatus Krumholzibacteria bacterium]